MQSSMSMTMGMSIIRRLFDCPDVMGHAPSAYIDVYLATSSDAEHACTAQYHVYITFRVPGHVVHIFLQVGLLAWKLLLSLYICCYY